MQNQMIMALVGLFLCAGIAHARDVDGKYANSPNKKWFEEQRNDAGMSCCAESDGHIYEGDYKINADGSIEAEGEKIEAYKVLKSANPIGNAVWWYVDTAYGRTTYCFIPGSLT